MRGGEAVSESDFLKKEYGDFLAQHPRKDGWKVYECHERLSRMLSLYYLLDFIRDKHPEILKKRHAPAEVRTEDMMGEPDDSHPVEKGNEWDETKELDANGWIGDIEVEWTGQPIHYHAFYVIGKDQMHGRMGEIILVATKSNAAMRDIHRSLDEYSLSREKKEEKTIRVINGLGIPILPVSWNDIFLGEWLKEDIRSNVDSFFQSKEIYQEVGISYRRGFLLTGPPGNGKTLTIKCLAYNIKASFVTVITKAEVEEGEIEAAFYHASRMAPAVIVFEDLDRLVESKAVSLSHFLNLLDGFKVTEGVLVIATSNHPEKLDQALLHRPSRFDRIFRFPLPGLIQRQALLEKKGARYFSIETIKAAAKGSSGFSMAYVQEIVINALLDWHYNGRGDDKDRYLLKSLETLKAQRKGASKLDEELADRENIGFLTPEGRSFGPVLSPELMPVS